jgi:5'-nucleotidase
MKILLTNDDGIDAPGLFALRDQLEKIASLVIVAPKFQKSATSAALTLYEPLVLEKKKEKRIKCYSLTGTPVDCVKLAISKLFKKPPDLVISGINRGLNTGSLVLYSGTIAAALEANLLNLTSIAISLEDCEKPDFKTAALISKKVVETCI